MEPESHVGRRVREIRTYRDLTQTTLAQLAGLSQSTLSRIESGDTGAERKATVEALAAALQVAPADLMGQPLAPTTPTEARGHTAVDHLRGVLRDVEIGAPAADVPVPTPEQLRAGLAAATAHREDCDYAALGDAVPELLRAAYSATSAGSVAAREPLVGALMLAFRLAKDLGHRDVAWWVAGHLHGAASALSDPAWIAVADFIRAEAMTGTGSRERALALVERAARDVEPGSGPNGEAYGLLRLSAALQSAIVGDVAAVPAFLDEAADVARHTGESNFAGQHFGGRNVGVWRVGLAVEVGDMDRVPELAQSVDVEAIPSAGRRASFFVDLGRGLAARRSSAEAAVEAFRRAENLAPQTTHADPFVREAVGDLLRRARRDAGGRELRGMAWRMGLAG